MTTVRLTDIAFDAGTQIRAAIDQQVVADYAEAMTAGAQFPPIVLFHDGNKHYLADGFHRFMAAQRNEFRDIDADVRAGTHQDALWFALGANKANGKRLNEADKSHAVAMALSQWPQKMQREIAEQVGCSESLVSKVAQEITSNTSGEPDLRGRALAAQTKRDAIRKMVQAGEQSVDIKEKLGAHPQLIAEVRREMGVGNADKSKSAVAQRRQDIREMAERGFASRQIAVHLGITESAVRDIAGKEAVVIHADRVMANTKRHDSTRIVETMVMDAENLTADIALIDFASLPKESLARWIDSLGASQKSIAAFIKRLKKERTRVEAA